MVIITCCSFAFGPALTSHSLLPGDDLTSCADSYSACAAHGSSTAGSMVSFLSTGPAGPVMGSSVCRGSGTMLPQTTT